RSPDLGVHEGDSEDVLGDSAGLEGPGLASVSGPQNGSRIADRSPNLGVHECHTVKGLGGPAGLSGPSLSTVRAAQNGSEPADRDGVASVQDGNTGEDVPHRFWILKEPACFCE